MDPKHRRETRTELIQDPQDIVIPTDEVQIREYDQDEYYESPIDFEGFYSDRIELRG